MPNHFACVIMMLAFCSAVPQVWGQARTFELANLNGKNGFVILGAAEGDHSGRSVSTAGDVNDDGVADIILGAPLADPSGANSGRSYVVLGDSNVGSSGRMDLRDLDGDNGFVINGELVDAMTGLSVSGGGDLNADGVDDLIIGSPGDLLATDTSGRVHVVFGREGLGTGGAFNLSDLDGSNGFRVETPVLPLDPEFFAFSVSQVGDVNNDRINDFAVADEFGQRWFTFFGSANVGATGVMSPNDLDGTDGFRVGSNTTSGARSVRFAVSDLGDINGDGVDDLVLGNGANDAPISYVIFGGDNIGSSGIIDADAELEGTNGFKVVAGDEDIAGLSGAGDVNGDGFADLIMGRANGGAASYVVFGGRDIGTGGEVDVQQLDGPKGFAITEQGFGSHQVSSAGDINGDGYGDLIIGSIGASPDGITFAGQSYLLFGRSDLGLTGSIDLGQLGFDGWVFKGINERDFSGLAVSGAGDINADGLDDLIISSSASPDGRTSAGETYVLFGPIPEPSSQMLVTIGLLLLLNSGRRSCCGA